jgi:hypothetical protein
VAAAALVNEAAALGGNRGGVGKRSEPVAEAAAEAARGGGNCGGRGRRGERRPGGRCGSWR